jgi:hypothetical protein
MGLFDRHKSGLWTLSLRSPCSYSHYTQLIQLIRDQVDLLPEIKPERWDLTEPLRQPFVPIDQLDNWIPGIIEPGYVMWQRKRKFKAEGGWRSGVAPNFPNPNAISRHSNLSITSDNFGLQDAVVRFMKAMPARMACDIGTLETASLNYIETGRANQVCTSGGAHYSITTHTLRHWLPDMLWGMVFGPPYVRMFGLERLLSAPVHTALQIAPETVYLQLTEDWRDNELRFEHLQAKRLVAKNHLGIEHFWSPEKNYDRHEHPELAGQVFKVPQFDLWPDPAPGLAQKLQNWIDRVRG